MEWELFRPVWSPDSKQLALHNGQGDLFLVQMDGKGMRPVTQGMQAKATWSPDGKRLALWSLGRYGEVSTSLGLERFLPPVGKEEAALSDAEIIRRYFLRVLTTTPNANFLGNFFNTYVDFLAVYAQTLEQQGKREAAQMYFCQGIEEVVSSKPWQGWALGPELEGTYAACQQRGQEEIGKNSPEATVPQPTLPHLKRPDWRPGQVLPWKAKQGADMQNSSTSPRAELSRGSQQSPSRYIV